MARAIREHHGHAGDLSCEIWGPHDVYFFRNICRIMEPFRSFFRGQHFVCERVLRSGRRTKEEKEGFGGFLVTTTTTTPVSYYYYYLSQL